MKSLMSQFIYAQDQIRECLRSLRIDSILLFTYKCLLNKECEPPDGEHDLYGFFHYIYEQFSQHLRDMRDAIIRAEDIYSKMQ